MNLVYSDCEFLPVSEKFMIVILINIWTYLQNKINFFLIIFTSV
jgi:hypothetical protein